MIKKLVYTLFLSFFFVIFLASIGCNVLPSKEQDSVEPQTEQVGEQATPFINPTATSTVSPSATPTIVPSPTATTAPTATATPIPSPTPNTVLANGLILYLPNASHHVIIKNGQVERLSYEDALLLGANAPLVGMAVGPDGQLFSLSNTFVDGLQLVTIAVQQGNSSKETFFDDPVYEARRIFGIVGEWLIVSLVAKEPPSGQAFGDLAAISLDGSQIEMIGQNTEMTPIVSPDQSFVIFHENGQTKRWQPNAPNEILSLPAYWFGKFSPDGRYLALVDQELNIFDFQDYTLVVSDDVGNYLGGFGALEMLWNRTSTLLGYTSFREEADAWVLRIVTVTGTTADYPNYFGPAFSPDGAQMAVRLGGDEPQNLIVDLASGDATPFAFRSGQFTAADPIFWLGLGSDE